MEAGMEQMTAAEGREAIDNILMKSQIYNLYLKGFSAYDIEKKLRVRILFPVGMQLRDILKTIHAGNYEVEGIK